MGFRKNIMYFHWRSMYLPLIFSKLMWTFVRTFNTFLLPTYLEGYLEFDARTGTVVKVSVSTLSLAISFCVLKHFPVIKTEKTKNVCSKNRIWISFRTSKICLNQWIIQETSQITDTHRAGRTFFKVKYSHSLLWNLEDHRRYPTPHPTILS